MGSIAYNMDCMEGMKQYPDKYFHLAVVDPPYGDGSQNVQVERERGETDSEGGSTSTRRTVNRAKWHGKDKYWLGQQEPPERERTGRHGQGKNCRKPDGTWGYANWRNVGGEVCKKIISWDVAPGAEYFEELFRISRNQIIWGGNYFPLPPTRCFLVWRKLTISETFSMAMAEYAWTSFNDNAKVFEYAPQDSKRFHPTQKPKALYDWIFKLYGKPGMKIIDTHLGSGSSRLSAYDAGLDFVGYEIDETYFKLQEERFATHISQQSLFLDYEQETFEEVNFIE